MHGVAPDNRVLNNAPGKQCFISVISSCVVRIRIQNAYQLRSATYAPAWVTRKLEIRIPGAVLRRRDLIKTHPREARGKQADVGDYPPEKIPSTCAPRP